MPHGAPTIDDLGRDLLRVSAARKALSLASPFLIAALFFIFAARGWWIPAVACTMVLSFITYGSLSHHLGERTLLLPPVVRPPLCGPRPLPLPPCPNEPLLALMDLIAFRSSIAYRWTHLHHHARLPSADDSEVA